MKFTFKPLLILLAVVILNSCSKNDDQNDDCYESIFIPISALDWLPYYSLEGDITMDHHVNLEDETIFVNQRDYIFYNSQLDSQIWRLVYVVDDFKSEVLIDCPEYQSIKFVLYNSDLDKHIELSLENKSSSDQSSSYNEFITKLRVAACESRHEDSNGIIGGLCYSTSFKIAGEITNPQIDFLEEFETSNFQYQNVYKAKIDFTSDLNLNYNFFISKSHGLIAYEFEGQIWELN